MKCVGVVACTFQMGGGGGGAGRAVVGEWRGLCCAERQGRKHVDQRMEGAAASGSGNGVSVCCSSKLACVAILIIFLIQRIYQFILTVFHQCSLDQK